MQTNSLQGVFAPVLTPLDADMNPDVMKLAARCQHLLANGCDGIVLFGTTGEANSFSTLERMVVLEGLIEAGVPAQRIMVGTGVPALTETATLSADATRHGCAGVLTLPPFYYKGVSDEGLFRSYSQVIDRVNDDRLRLYLYHIPQISGVGISLGLIERLVKTFPDQVVGIKDSTGDWQNLGAILDNFPGFGTFSGTEALLLKTMQKGGRGTISAVANVIPDQIQALFQNWQAPDAESRQADLMWMRDALKGVAAIPALKTIVAQETQDPTWEWVRPPLTSLRAEQKAALLQAVAS